METQRKLIVGYDLCEDFSQISCYSYKTFEPIPICQNEREEESSLIPTALFIKNDTRLWYYGKEAINGSLNDEGILIDGLISRLRNKEQIEVYEQRLSGVDLMEKFLRKTLTLIKNYFPTDTITKLVITVREMEPVVVEGIYEALSILGILKDRAVIMSHASAYMYFALSQDRSLWVNDVALFDFNENSLNYYQISINRRVTPMIAGMEKKEFTDTLSYSMLKENGLNISYIFENIVNNVLHKQIISTIYFTGKGFEGNWADEVIKSLCTGRRVFLGHNLYTKGACFAAKELVGDCKLSDFILLNDEMIVSSVWIRVYSDASMKEIALTDAAIPWYDIDQTIEVIPDDETELEFVFRNIMTREIRRERFQITKLPDRPNRMTRMEINLTCIDKSKVKIRVTDLGFGDLYPPSGLTWEYLLDI
ncbi:hypothetical protein I5677_11470 [Mobilitalea sibirica]|uniref:DUF5716 domain-containing protein n=1 Tax=Mobilitalea sibirica TaxID=1462919 RepID=A0A8J7L2Z9_9FIRM|nr:DUF5716 family protein [Mobilitalea sibirica]MBH1941513.1 hypothetical protein [Mobilitalea sibirica]